MKTFAKVLGVAAMIAAGAAICAKVIGKHTDTKSRTQEALEEDDYWDDFEMEETPLPTAAEQEPMEEEEIEICMDLEEQEEEL